MHCTHPPNLPDHRTRLRCPTHARFQQYINHTPGRLRLLCPEPSPSLRAPAFLIPCHSTSGQKPGLYTSAGCYMLYAMLLAKDAQSLRKYRADQSITKRIFQKQQLGMAHCQQELIIHLPCSKFESCERPARGVHHENTFSRTVRMHATSTGQAPYHASLNIYQALGRRQLAVRQAVDVGCRPQTSICWSMRLARLPFGTVGARGTKTPSSSGDWFHAPAVVYRRPM